MDVRAGGVRATVAVLAAAVVAFSPGAAGAASGRDDPNVQDALEEAQRARQERRDAERRLDERQQTLEAVSGDLDRAAEAYERANSHHQRLRGEREGSAARVEVAQDRSDSARDAFADQVATMYKHGPLELRLSDFVLAADSPSTAFHRVGLIGRVSEGGARRLRDAERLLALTSDDDRQHAVVTHGSESSAAALKLRSDELALAMQTAEQAVAAASGELDESEAQIARADARVEREIEAAARRRAAEIRRIAAADLEGRGYRLPSVDGKVCPIGAPHGFSDSWLAPRPGGRQHLGVDMFAVHGMPLYAVTDGTVRVSTNRLGGLVIHLDADGGDRYYYAHLSAVSVSTGDRVSAGDPIGANGNSGNARSTPPHLHWQYHPGGGPAVNPYPLARALCR